MRPTQATVRLDVIAENVRRLSSLVPDSQLCCVVKADGYGHGALPTARVVVKAGITYLAVALVEEGVELRQGGIQVPILLLSEPRPKEMGEVVEYGLCPTLYSDTGIAAVSAAVELNTKQGNQLPVHLKVDTGMHRVGAEFNQAIILAKAIEEKSNLHLEGVWTHLAVADEPDNPQNQVQFQEYQAFLQALAKAGINPTCRHVTNSAGYLNFPEHSYDLARVGISIYGILPKSVPKELVKLTPAMDLSSSVTFVKQVPKGAGISYGLRYTTETEALIATVPIGYADGIRREYDLCGGEVLINNKRHPIVGSVTMDQLMVQCVDENVSPGDEVVLLGRQGEEEITTTEMADKLGTIPYEVICDIGVRVRREYV